MRLQEMNNDTSRTHALTGLRTVSVILFLSLVPLAGAAENCEQLGIFDVYDRVLPPGIMRPGEAETVTLRYIPGDTSIERELEFRIATTRSGMTTIDVTEARGLSIQSQFTTLKDESVGLCDSALVSKIAMERRRAPAKIGKAIRRELMRKRFSVELEGDIYLDAGRYEIWIKTPMNMVSWTLYGPNERRKVHPLIEWANASMSSLRRKVEGAGKP